MKVREIDMESLMAASPTTGFTEHSDGTETQHAVLNGETSDGSTALSNYNVWSLNEDEE